MVRINPYGMRKSLSTSYGLIKFWHITNKNTEEYDAITQRPVYTGTLVEENSDILDVSSEEIKVIGGLIDEESKKYVVGINNDLEKGDEIVSDTLLQEYNIVFTRIYANRKELFANKVEEEPNQH